MPFLVNKYGESQLIRRLELIPPTCLVWHRGASAGTAISGKRHHTTGSHALSRVLPHPTTAVHSSSRSVVARSVWHDRPPPLAPARRQSEGAFHVGECGRPPGVNLFARMDSHSVCEHRLHASSSNRRVCGAAAAATDEFRFNRSCRRPTGTPTGVAVGDWDTQSTPRQRVQKGSPPVA